MTNQRRKERVAGDMDKIRIGTRGSKLALKQVALVQEALSRTDQRIVTELVILRTRGDRIQDRPLSEIGDKGVFASELEQALLSGQIDMAVHSAKDLPMKLADGLGIVAVLPRADVRDVLVVPKGGRTPVGRQGVCGAYERLNADAADGKRRKASENSGTIFRIGTGSRRRQLLAGKIWENVVCEEIRGNVDTRLGKLQEGGYDGIILAKAGLDRLGSNPDWESAFDFYPLSPELFLPAACQGIIAVEAVEDSAAAEICGKIADEETMLCFQVEREVLAQLLADCSEAAAAWCRMAQSVRLPEAMQEVAWDSRKAPNVWDESDSGAVDAAAGRCSGEDWPADRLLLDVMYAGCRASLTGAVSAVEGRRMAGHAAQEVKGRKG